MHSRLTIGIAMIASLGLLPASASASVEVGSRCAANAAETSYTLIQLSAGGNPLPLTIPTDGVITRWRTTAEPSASGWDQVFRVFRSTGIPGEFQTVGESGSELVQAGENSFPARVPVKAGDQLGVYGPERILYCLTGNPEDAAWSLIGDAPVGSTHLYAASAEIQVPVAAVVEPDVDRDGYGDETQDGCPQSAAFQGKCPVVALDARAKARGNSIVVTVSVDREAAVSVTGQVKWGFRPKRRTGSSKHNLIVALAGGTKTVSVGRTASFRVNLPRLVRKRLSGLTPSESLKAKLAVSAKNLAGPASVRKLTVKLRGRKRGR